MVTVTRESIIPTTLEAEDNNDERFLFPKISPIPEETERDTLHKNKLIKEGRKITTIITIA